MSECPKALSKLLRREVRAWMKLDRPSLQNPLFKVRRGDFESCFKLNSAEKELHVEVLQEKGSESLNYFFKFLT